jgi:hypothetical protein
MGSWFCCFPVRREHILHLRAKKLIRACVSLSPGLRVRERLVRCKGAPQQLARAHDVLQVWPETLLEFDRRTPEMTCELQSVMDLSELVYARPDSTRRGTALHPSQKPISTAC